MGSIDVEKIKKLLNESLNVKLITTVGKKEIPHAAKQDFLRVDENGYIEYLELLEGSRTNQNLVYSLWFEKKVSITVVTPEAGSFLIIGKPYKTIVAGKKYQEKYEYIKKWDSESELAAIWLIEPESISEETYSVKRVEEKKKNPYYVHLDSIAK